MPGIEVVGTAAQGSFQKFVVTIVPDVDAAENPDAGVTVTVTPFVVVAVGAVVLDVQVPVFDANAGALSRKYKATIPQNAQLIALPNEFPDNPTATTPFAPI